MAPRNYRGPKLPHELLGELGAVGTSRGSARNRGGVQERKARRKAQLLHKKLQRQQSRRFHPLALPDGSESNDDAGEDCLVAPPVKAVKPLKSILKRTGAPSISTVQEQGDMDEAAKKQGATQMRTLTPPPPSMPKRVRIKLNEDDDEIMALERKLGIKGNKRLPSDFGDDDLTDLLASLEDHTECAGKKKRPLQDQEWLDRKRQKTTGHIATEEGFSDCDCEDDARCWQHDELLDVDSMADSTSEEDVSPESHEAKLYTESSSVRENPYKPPVQAESGPTAKYIPPFLRGPLPSDTEMMMKLKRQLQGLLNRLSEANILSMLKDIEKVYQYNPRQHVTATLIDLVLALICDDTNLLNTFIILHAGFIAAVYKIIGPDFGAHLIERFVAEFDKYYTHHDEKSSRKETANLVSLLAEMYNFQVVSCKLIFDYIRMFLKELREINIELLLRIVRMSGYQLRQDDPTAVKDIVIMLQKSAATAGEANLSIRTKIMIETINDLKNNRLKTGAAASAIISEHTTRMKRTLSTLNSRSIRASEPLRVGLGDLQDTDTKGKWWLVGAGWRRDSADETAVERMLSDAEPDTEALTEEIIISRTTDLLALAQEQRMNTDIRRAIFISVMSASDFKDAHGRLAKLRLKKSQELEIPRVLIQCASAEKCYNPYYTLIARRLCSDKSLRKAFQFSLWDVFRRLGESGDTDDVELDEQPDDEEDLTMRKIVNLGRMFGSLIADGGLSIATLKTLDFGYLQPKTEVFVEVLMSTLILHSQKKHADRRNEEALLDVITEAKDAPHMARGLQYFLTKAVSKAEATASKKERATVKWGADVAADGLAVLATQQHLHVE